MTARSLGADALSLLVRCGLVVSIVILGASAVVRLALQSADWAWSISIFAHTTVMLWAWAYSVQSTREAEADFDAIFQLQAEVSRLQSPVARPITVIDGEVLHVVTLR